jgi:hypothetical protein
MPGPGECDHDDCPAAISRADRLKVPKARPARFEATEAALVARAPGAPPITTLALPRRKQDRRQSQRRPVERPRETRMTVRSQEVTLRDLSLGGFLIESPEAFEVNALHQFRVADGEGDWTAVLTARSAHCRRIHRTDGSSYFLTGFAFFFPHGREAWRRVCNLVGRETSVVCYTSA